MGDSTAGATGPGADVAAGGRVWPQHRFVRAVDRDVAGLRFRCAVNQVDSVVDDGRRINQVVARGKYGTDVAKLWATLRNGINDLARAYNVAPLGV